MVWHHNNSFSDSAAHRDCKISFTELQALIAVAMALVGIGIGVGKVLADISFLKKEAATMRKEHLEIKLEQIEMKLILKQIVRKLKISY